MWFHQDNMYEIPLFVTFDHVKQTKFNMWPCILYFLNDSCELIKRYVKFLWIYTNAKNVMV